MMKNKNVKSVRLKINIKIKNKEINSLIKNSFEIVLLFIV